MTKIYVPERKQKRFFQSGEWILDLEAVVMLCMRDTQYWIILRDYSSSISADAFEGISKALIEYRRNQGTME